MPGQALATVMTTLRRSQLLTPEALRELDHLEHEHHDPKELVRAVLKRGWLTAYQARELFSGLHVDFATQTLAELRPAPGEAETVAAFRKLVSDVRFWKEPLEKPVLGCMTSRFGVKRLTELPAPVFNDALATVNNPPKQLQRKAA